MILASLTLTSNRKDIIGDALRSVVDHVDLCVLIDLGMTDDTAQVAREIVGDKLRIVPFIPCDSPRNCGLDAAEALGADWAMTLDTDERMNFNSAEIKKALAQIGAGTVLVPHDSGCYCKERFFKIPAMDRFTGHVHECVYPQNTQQVFMAGITFSELPKTPEQSRAKAASYVDHLFEQTRKTPEVTRWWYYLGDTLMVLERNEEALEAFVKCAELRGWDEESAWSCFRAATILASSGKPFEAIEMCGKGLTRYPGMAELAWLAGEISLSAGHFDKALYWGRMAAANGMRDGEGKLIRPRTGYRHIYGMSEGPYALMASAYDGLGMAQQRDECREVLNEMKPKEATHA